MTTRGSLKKPDTGGHSHLEPLPDPPREPDMQQRRRTAAFDAILMAHFAHRNNVLISGDGYLRRDPANEDEQFAPDCVVASRNTGGSTTPTDAITTRPWRETY